MATPTALTLDQFLALPGTEDGTHYELSAGELITLSAPSYRHGVVVLNIAGVLRDVFDRKKFSITGADAGFILNKDQEPATVRGADLAVSHREDLGKIPGTGYVAKAPALAVEVVSPGNDASDLERKVNEYLTAGALEVWLVYPKTQHVHVFHRSGEFRVFQSHDRFRSILGPEFEVPAFFED